MKNINNKIINQYNKYTFIRMFKGMCGGGGVDAGAGGIVVNPAVHTKNKLLNRGIIGIKATVLLNFNRNKNINWNMNNKIYAT